MKQQSNFSRRFDIYLNGTDGLKELSKNLFLSWRTVPYHAKRAGKSAIDLAWYLLPVVMALLGPVLALFAPLLALKTAHRVLTDEEAIERSNEIYRQAYGVQEDVE